jgi:hypothetical protein
MSNIYGDNGPICGDCMGTGYLTLIVPRFEAARERWLCTRCKGTGVHN